MRVSNSMMTQSMISRIGQSTESLYKLQEQIATGLRINRPSDAPVAAVHAASLRSALAETAQYKSNVEEATSLMAMTDSALSEITNLVRSVREAGLAGATCTTDETAMTALAGTVEQTLAALVRVANSERAGRFLFAGFKTNATPFELNPGGPPPVNYLGDNGTIDFEVGRSSTIAVNLTGDEVFNMTGGAVPGIPDLFSSVDGLKEALLAGDTVLIQQSVEELDEHLSHLLSMRGEVGARQQSLELALNRLSDNELYLRNSLSVTEDADLTEVMVKLQAQQNIYQASAAVAAMIGQLGLMEYMQ